MVDVMVCCSATVHVHAWSERESNIHTYVCNACIYIHTQTCIFYIHINTSSMVEGNILNKFCLVLKSQLNNNDCFLTKK